MFGDVDYDPACSYPVSQTDVSAQPKHPRYRRAAMPWQLLRGCGQGVGGIPPPKGKRAHALTQN